MKVILRETRQSQLIINRVSQGFSLEGPIKVHMKSKVTAMNSAGSVLLVSLENNESVVYDFAAQSERTIRNPSSKVRSNSR